MGDEQARDYDEERGDEKCRSSQCEFVAGIY